MVSSQVEYGCCGLSEEDAIKLYGEDNIETYLFEFGSLEHQVHLWLRGTGKGKHGSSRSVCQNTVFCTGIPLIFVFCEDTEWYHEWAAMQCSMVRNYAPEKYTRIIWKYFIMPSKEIR